MEDADAFIFACLQPQHHRRSSDSHDNMIDNTNIRRDGQRLLEESGVGCRGVGTASNYFLII